MTFLGLRRQAVPDRQLQHLERAGQGAPRRARLRRPGQPGRGVALADPAQAGGKKLLVGACDLDQVAMEGVRDGYVEALISPEHWLKGYLAIKLMADAKQRRQGAARGHVELRRADRQQGQHRRDHRPPEGRRPREPPTSRTRSPSSSATHDQYLGPMPRARRARGPGRQQDATAAWSPSPARTSRSAPASVHALLGENGAGKSTLVKIIAGAAGARTRARCGWTARRCASLPPRRRCARGVAVVSQELNLFPDLDVLSNLFTHARAHARAVRPTRRDGRARRGRCSRELGLDVPLRAPVGELTLAQRQLVEIAKALLTEPRVLILDEPTSALGRASAPRCCSTRCACCATARSASSSSRTSSRT